MVSSRIQRHDVQMLWQLVHIMGDIMGQLWKQCQHQGVLHGCWREPSAQGEHGSPAVLVGCTHNQPHSSGCASPQGMGPLPKHLLVQGFQMVPCTHVCMTHTER